MTMTAAAESVPLFDIKQILIRHRGDEEDPKYSANLLLGCSSSSCAHFVVLPACRCILRLPLVMNVWP